MEQRTRESIPETYKWRMTDIYPDTTAWEEDLAGIGELTARVTACQGRLADSGVLEECLRLYEELSRRIERVYAYARMLQDLDNADPQAQAMQERALHELYRAQEATAFLVPEMTALPADTLRERAAAPAMAPYRHMIDDILRTRAHILSTREEQLLAMAAPAMESLEAAFGMLESVDLKLGEVTDEEGNTVELTNGLFATLRESRDRRVRADAFRTLHEAYAGMGNTIAALYGGQVKADVFAARARGYADALDAALFRDALPRALYTGLIDAVHAALPENHRCLELRRRLLGVEKLHIYDSYVPLVTMPEQTYSYEQACAMVKQYLRPLGEPYGRALEQLLGGGWVDVYETANKTTGAYATGIYGVHPYMLLNYVGKLNDVFTVAHEAGHCLHTHYADSAQPYVNHDYPIFLAEIASTVNENILLRGMTAACDTAAPAGRREKAYLLGHFLEEFRGTVIRQTMFAEFELKVHEMAERGEPLTAQALCGVYHGLLTAYFGPAVEIDPYMDWEWARIPHFYNAFYVFKYATGFAAAAAISRQILDGGDVEPYLDFLRAGGSDYPAETLKRAGVDMTTPRPVEAALAEFSSVLDAFEALLAADGGGDE